MIYLSTNLVPLVGNDIAFAQLRCSGNVLREAQLCAFERSIALKQESHRSFRISWQWVKRHMAHWGSHMYCFLTFYRSYCLLTFYRINLAYRMFSKSVNSFVNTSIIDSISSLLVSWRDPRVYWHSQTEEVRFRPLSQTAMLAEERLPVKKKTTIASMLVE